MPAGGPVIATRTIFKRLKDSCPSLRRSARTEVQPRTDLKAVYFEARAAFHLDAFLPRQVRTLDAGHQVRIGGDVPAGG